MVEGGAERWGRGADKRAGRQGDGERFPLCTSAPLPTRGAGEQGRGRGERESEGQGSKGEEEQGRRVRIHL